MSTFEKHPESKTKIRFHDCDPYNHLNNARYIDYFLSARGDQLIEYYNFDMYALARDKGIGWVSAQTQISYLSPALLMEEVWIQTQLLAYSNKSLLMEGLMWNYDKSQLKAVMWGKLVHFDIRRQKIVEHTEELMNFFGRIVDVPAIPQDFEERVQSLKQIINVRPLPASH